MVFEQLESVWPVHGSVLVEDGVASFVCGRSCFLDGGMKFFRLDAKTGKKLVEVAFTDRDPESGKPLDELHKTLQMPTALSDILSSDGKGTIYLRSQKIDHEGKRVDIAPVSGNAIEQGAAQKGEHPHLFAAFGYLDAEWFHRALWIYGENSSGGHNGYYQPGKYTPTGRILVFDDENVYSYGRESKYLKWTTTMEHTLQASSKIAPDVKIDPSAAEGKKAGAKPPGVTFPDADSLNPADKALTSGVLDPARRQGRCPRQPRGRTDGLRAEPERRQARLPRPRRGFENADGCRRAGASCGRMAPPCRGPRHRSGDDAVCRRGSGGQGNREGFPGPPEGTAQLRRGRGPVGRS
jgi:hypothetical protein